MNKISSITKRIATLKTHKIHTLPILIMMPHSRCNCRCVMCDIWKANAHKKEISAETLQQHLETILKLGVEHVSFTGGEALMHSNLWNLCKLLKAHDIYISLLSTGLLLNRHAENVIEYCDTVIVSLDGPKELHNEIRRIPKAFEKLEEGIKALRKIKPDYPVTGRCVLQHLNFRQLHKIIEAAKELGLDQISFLGADVSSAAFNRPEQWEDEKVVQIALSEEEVEEFNDIMESTIQRFQSEFDRKFIAESPEKMRRIVQYYRAIHGKANYPKVSCNAPWVSTVIETNGDVLPCYFHPKLGNIYDNSLEEILNSAEAIQFRKTLDMDKDEICKKCVCSLKLPVHASVQT